MNIFDTGRYNKFLYLYGIKETKEVNPRYLCFQPLVRRRVSRSEMQLVPYRFAGETRWTLMNNEWRRKTERSGRVKD